MKNKLTDRDAVWHPCKNDCGARYRSEKAAALCCDRQTVKAEIARRYDIPRIQGERPL